MSDDQLERAIDFLLKSQASHEARMQQLAEQTAEQLARSAERQVGTEEILKQLSERVDSFADTQGRVMLVMTQTLEAQAKINKDLRAAYKSLKASDESLRAVMTELAERQVQTGATVDRL